MRVLLTYLLVPALLSLLSCEICPFIEGLGRLTMFGLLEVAFVLALLCRGRIEPLVERRPIELQAGLMLRIDLVLLNSSTAVIGVWNTVIYGFPMGSGIKMLLSAMILALIGAVDLSINHQHQQLTTAIKRQEVFPSVLRTPLARKVAAFYIALALLATLTLQMMLMQDLSGLDAAELGAAGKALATEIVTVSVLSLALVLNVILSFIRLVNLVLHSETQALLNVAKGDLSSKVFVGSDDELGLIAAQTNAMIDQLRSSQQIKTVFGKMLSPAVAQELMNDPDRAARLGGERRNAVVMFTDIRGFTARSESQPPEQLVAWLNQYFTLMVENVHHFDGIVDKFMGDGMMIIFFESEQADSAANRALSCAQACIESIKRSFPELRIGVGLHYGSLIAGKIGSSSRMECTVIGDTVNVAARLESMTKELGATILCSSTVYQQLAESPFNDFGMVNIRGKEEPLRIWGLAAT